MIAMETREVARLVGGQLHGAGDVRIHGVNTDSRKNLEGALFVALRGERFDGHDFIGPSLAAAALLVEKVVDDPRPQVVVADVLEALAALANAWRGRSPAKVVALTGSNGKTTTKEMLRAILSRVGTVHATEGNLNNHIGVPLTLLAMPPVVDYAVIEMGANHAGEIARLTRCARPDVALITNAGRAHLEGFGSLEGVARAKGEIYEGLPGNGGAAVINRDDRFAEYWLSLNQGRRCLGFSLEGRGEIQGVWHGANRMSLSVDGVRRDVVLAAPGRHMAQNALAAAAAVSALGCDSAVIAHGLEAWRPVAGRLRSYRDASGARIWDDTYNANPDSLAAALDVLSAHQGLKVLVLGDMNELGRDGAALHAEMGQRVRDAGVQRMLALGSLTPAAVTAFGAGAAWFATHAELTDALRSLLRPDTVVLVKGSRSQHMEDILAGLDLQPVSAAGEVGDAVDAG